jgi:cysteine desulfuration protein SufE
MSTLQKEASDLIESFEMFDEWEDRYRFLIDLGKELPPFPDEERTDENKVHGCQSNVWMIASPHETGGQTSIDFLADSDAHIVRGLIAILMKLYSGRTANEIMNFDVDGFFRQLGLDQHLSMGRRNGLSGMVARIRNLATQLSSSPVTTN